MRKALLSMCNPKRLAFVASSVVLASWIVVAWIYAQDQTPPNDGKPRAANPPAPSAAKPFREHVAFLASDDLGGRDVGSPGSAKAMQYLVRHFKDAGLKGLGSQDDWYQDFPFGEKKKTTARNVLAVFPGKGALAGEAIIVSTHHDHIGTNAALVKDGKDGIFNGADDNASGCAAVLLVAQALSAERERLPAAHRTVIFASFDAEERGLAGSRYYVRNPLWPLDKTAANINFDMVGRLFLQKVMALDGESSAFLAERITALAGQCGLRVETRLSGSGRADNASFLDKAIPAVHFNSGLHADYHQVSDEVGKIDSDGGARISWLGYRLLREMMDHPERLRFRRPPPEFDVGVVLRLAFRLGLMPEQNAQSGKYPLIRFVLPNSIAAKQGFQANDEITSINGQKFENAVDAAPLLGKIRLDRDIKMTVQRQGQAVELTIPAEALKDFAGPTARPLDKDRYEVTFRYKPAKKADSVSLAGTFNTWDAKALAMAGPDKDGFYSVRQTLTRGVYEYKFVVNGSEWLSDPSNLRTVGPVGNSLLLLGGD
jgi:hypothetical protein